MENVQIARFPIQKLARYLYPFCSAAERQEPVDGALVQLELSRPKCLWQWKRNAGILVSVRTHRPHHEGPDWVFPTCLRHTAFLPPTSFRKDRSKRLSEPFEAVTFYLSEPVCQKLLVYVLAEPGGGMYAFICMPEYAPLQWHPMTITSGNEDETVNFLIAGIGDWTQDREAIAFSAFRGDRWDGEAVGLYLICDIKLYLKHKQSPQNEKEMTCPCVYFCCTPIHVL